jgi:tRNA pseudouridine65 synthase
LFLHAGRLEFTHPYSEKPLKLNAAFPEDWIFIYKKFSWKNPTE